MNFSSIHRKARTEVWLSLTFGFWALAAAVHLAHNYGKDKDELHEWVLEILVTGLFATGFGWHLHKLVSLHKMEKRGKLHSFDKEL